MKKSAKHCFPSFLTALRTTSFALAACATAIVTSIPAASAESPARLVPWHQGFEHDTNGWFDSTDAGALGWCGSIDRVTREDAAADSPGPSAGRGYATVSSGPCNNFWTSLGVPFGAPYGPGQDLQGAFRAWPGAGYVTDLDVYLDPAWSGNYYGNYEFAGVPASTIIQYAATIFEADYLPGELHTGPHYFVDVQAAEGQNALTVGNYTVTEAGWYKFRFRFSDNDGDVQVDFELQDRSGGKLAELANIEPTNLLGPFRTPFTDAVETAGYSSGWVWFFDIASGLALPIDQHRQRPGR